MKNAILIHGTGGTPDLFWFPWMKKKLEAKGYSVWVPQIPETDNPTVDVWVPYILKNGTFTEETIIIGHSAGSPAILALLEKIQVKVKQAILIAAYFEPINSVTGILKESYDWELIKSHVNDLVIINSDNDPWKCDDKEGIRLFERVGGTLILRHGEGHMGSVMFEQPYTEFPLLLKLID